MTTYTATERKAATRDALALLTASLDAAFDVLPLVEVLIDEVGDRLPLVLASVVGLASGLLFSFDDEYEGAADRWLRCIGERVEAMPEGGA